MIETLRRKGITEALIAVVMGSLLLSVLSVIIGVLAEFGSASWIKALRTWAFCLRLPFGIVVAITLFSLGKWIIFNRESRASLVSNSSVFVFSILLLLGSLNFLKWIDNRAISAQFDIVEEICQEGFEDPSTLEKYQAKDTLVGNWDYVLVWEDESHNAIWFDSCNSLSSCGVMCVRDGISLKDSTNEYQSREFRYIRDGLYWWD